ncbi:MAG: hypothetical protein Q7U98_17100 [Methylicorpusculum sp.]|uniref:hypothetical protein n=1 Tax=Methylicorpusculum sp. TaxID=2713644 RepID=UPI002717CEAC|nr:hypothetical protein [Methylicorpusculum sp.]MDO8940874.1 hypothetical protein [Methylicorpusculum sp.]
MQLNRCPICHHRISLDALAQDEAGRELLGLLAAMNTDSGTALVSYLGLFRSVNRDLANDRALKLCKEALALAPVQMVTAAMRQTVESVRAKGGKSLTNHNYLKRVLEDRLLNGVDSAGDQLIKGTDQPNPPEKAKSKTAQALQALEDFGNGT